MKMTPGINVYCWRNGSSWLLAVFWERISRHYEVIKFGSLRNSPGGDLNSQLSRVQVNGVLRQ